MTSINDASTIIKTGGILIYPTDTAFGIGCRADDEHAVERVFQLRRRPQEKATPILVSSSGMAKTLWDSPQPEAVDGFIKKYWPGALTIIYHSHTSEIVPLARGGGTTVGLRMPDHETILEIIRGAGVPILGCSANFAGFPTPHAFEELDPDLVTLVDGVVEGSCKHSLASTVVDCTKDPWEIVRQGAIKL